LCLGGIGVIERLTGSRKCALFVVVAALVWLPASLLSCPQVALKSVSKAGVHITAAMPSPGPIMKAIVDDDREFQEEDLEPGGLPGLRLVCPASVTSRITPPQSVSLSLLTSAQRPLRC
jgi:hypothetical protein